MTAGSLQILVIMIKIIKMKVIMIKVIKNKMIMIRMIKIKMKEWYWYWYWYHESGIETRRKAAPQMTKPSHQAPTQEEESELKKSYRIGISRIFRATWPRPRSRCEKLRNGLLLSSQWQDPLQILVIS